MKYDFKGKAIKCDTWEQMEQLFDIARKQGYEPLYRLSGLRSYFPKDCLFAICEIYPDKVSNYPESDFEKNDIIVSFTDFITTPCHK